VIKTFLAGIILGLLGSGALAYFVPVVDLERERSHITVRPNGGNIELFVIDPNRDRIMAFDASEAVTYPDEVVWPAGDRLEDLRTELYKVRNRDDKVIGVASRMAIDDGGQNFSEWAIHLPARGSLYVSMNTGTTQGLDSDSARSGVFRKGTREFASHSGTVVERRVLRDEEGGEQAPLIEIETALVGVFGDDE